MKKLLLLATLVLGAVSCMKDQSFEAGKGGETDFVLSVALPSEATRAIGQDSALGAIDNDIDLSQYDIRYVLGVYDANGNLAKREVKYEDATETTFALRLIPGRDYRFVVWADFVSEGSKTALHYDVEELTNIKLIGDQKAMDETRDAYTDVVEIKKFNSASTVELKLKRPFAKLRVVTNDMDELYTEAALVSGKVVYTQQVYTTFNALTAEAGELARVEKEFLYNDATSYTEKAADEKTLFADYLFGAENDVIYFTLDVVDATGLEIDQVVFNTNIPVKRNHLTTIYGPVLTDANSVSVKINDNFAEPEYVVDIWDGVSVTEPEVTTDPVSGEPVMVVDSAADFAWIAAYVNGLQASTFATRSNDVMNIVLKADIDLDNHPWTPIGSAYTEHGFMGNFDGNGYSIKNLNITTLTPDADGYVYAGLFGVTEGTPENHNSIKNLTIENVTIETEGNIVAAAVAYPYYTDLENIVVKGNVSIKGGNYTSGVLAYTRRCVNAKNIAIEANAGSVIEGNMTVGGVISDIQMNGGLVANYSNFKASGLTVKGAMHVGGISGIISNQTLNGAAVENVAIVSDDVRKGALAGSLGEASVINDAYVNNVAGVENLVGATFALGSGKTVEINGVKYVYNDGWYSVGTICTLGGQKAIVYSVENGIKAVSVEQGGEMTWDESMAWAEGLGEGWSLASLEELKAVYSVRFALNEALAADSAENVLFEEDNKEDDGTYAAYWTSTLKEGTSSMPKAYYFYFDSKGRETTSFTMFTVEYSRAVYTL